MSKRLPVLRPQLPEAGRLLPYLRRIDATRSYSNWGPLTSEFEQRLAVHFGAGTHVISAASGTAALTAAILATAGRARHDRPLAIIPAFTFVATAIAVELCGFRPYLADVDSATWRLDMKRLKDGLDLVQVGLVVVVAPYGRPVPADEVTQFQERTGIPVVIDGGASLEGIERAPRAHVGAIPTALSLHATKSFATAEGGCVLTQDASLAVRVVRALNFGFHGRRLSVGPSLNGKMSEIHAAVGLAELDGWPDKRQRFQNLADAYRYHLDKADLPGRFIGAPDVAGCYALWEAPTIRQADSVRAALDAANVETRQWYGNGLLEHPQFAETDHERLEVTTDLAPRLVGLPVAVDLEEAEIARVVDAIRHGI